MCNLNGFLKMAIYHFVEIVINIVLPQIKLMELSNSHQLHIWNMILMYKLMYKRYRE